ncbi:transcription factor TGA9-like [Rhodamnia argentea]|uniref:Transcription factor TGA9-like n=1 Tax=Rhodamnia argentea TaxID=178133 RepID=A0ABM3HL45_9MYRT|nr:transcription factor TGA9-like [Rhodamnia argentea]
MASQRLGETGLSEAGPSSRHHHHHVPYPVLGINASSSSFSNQEGAAFDFGELEQAMVLQEVNIRNHEDHKATFHSSGRPSATLEMFPAWPMRFQQTPRGSSRSGEGESSGDSEWSGANNLGPTPLTSSKTEAQLELESPISNKASSSSSSAHQQRPQQQEMASVVSQDPPAASRSPQDNSKKKGSAGPTSEKNLDAKTLRRLAQNREAARKSRLRKKAYVQQLESSRIKLTQLEQEVQRTRSHGLLLGAYGGAGGDVSSGAAAFDLEYARWLDNDHRHMSELRTALNAHLSDSDLRMIVDGYISHYDEIFRLKGVAARTDVFHLLTGMWSSSAERCFFWMGGFRPSDLIKMLRPHLDPLTEQQLMGIYGLQQSSQQAEEALSQGLEQLQHSLVDTVAGGPLVESMQLMVVALGKLSNLESFVLQADNLRQQTLHQLWRILTVRQATRCFLMIGEYYGRLRALSSLWASRPRENSINDDGSCQTTTDLQVFQSAQNHFPPFG